MRLLLTNDDGIHAEGLVALENIAKVLSDDIWICAPEYEQSGASRALTLSDPVRVRKLDARRFATSGTPTDCVMLAISELMEGAKPDLVLSGVNRGANLAEDVTLSGTVAGAIEGMAMGIPSIALSQTGWPTGNDDIFAPAERFAPGIIRKLVETGWPKDVIINVNFPARPADEITEVEVTRQTFRDINVRHAEKRTDLRNREYYWMGFRQERSSPAAGTDLKAIYDGKISVTPLHIDLTHLETVYRLKGVLGGVPPKA
ncbi:MAG: 5'/3'-nucleotidase SurE [Phenylobacterium sp.]|uniref:5'/3'-nucleotidase SurE n=1 Tax=Phenylobacterium sp. TaxID=1871053 RepID=UPI001B6097A7|nr:5'/3'-nucleotidase SurE [Phenylobacterium sp.]MBP7816029.1 5'/3'-nucleotidase SurE [Phenylobacterium sp.]MBP9232925.1 5'/3'-nucleotidase SurE [Phenylobacterium sp.]MBP9756823.1 5'/3'-nucleotidase SurE [Phenylobacterium sp.]